LVAAAERSADMEVQEGRRRAADDIKSKVQNAQGRAHGNAINAVDKDEV